MASRSRAVEGSADPEIAQLAAALLAARERLSKLTVRGAGESTLEDYRMLLDAARRNIHKDFSAHCIT